MPAGFGRAHGRRSRGNLAHTGGSEHKHVTVTSHRDTPDGSCWGCYYHKREPWEHEPGQCPVWYARASDFSGA
jgi:hypothetical protein